MRLCSDIRNDLSLPSEDVVHVRLAVVNRDQLRRRLWKRRLHDNLLLGRWLLETSIGSSLLLRLRLRSCNYLLLCSYSLSLGHLCYSWLFQRPLKRCLLNHFGLFKGCLFV